MSAPFTPEQEARIREIAAGPALTAETICDTAAGIFRDGMADFNRRVARAAPQLAPAKRTSRTRGGFDA